MAALPERFKPLRRLGEGSFGTVHEALDTTTGERVAVKQLRRFDSDGLLRFKREFRSLADIRHPNLVRFGELLSEGEDWLFTMELVRGVSLLDYLTAESRSAGSSGASFRYRFDESRLRSTFSQLVEGVQAIHGVGLLHRDLKPSNVLVTAEGRVVILDFGLVAHLSEDNATRSTQIVGTPAYMSPEQADGKGVSTPSDWYSMGLMLYESLTGELPFKGSAYELIVKRHTQEAPKPSAGGRPVPEDLDDLCHRLLARAADGRPAYPELASAFRSGTSPIPRPTVTDDIFVGRGAELEVLGEAFARVQAGRPATVLIGGTSGIGKTSLVRRFLEEVERQSSGLLVLRGRCYQRESVPYKAFDGLIDDLTGYMNRLDSVEAARFLPRDWPALARLFPVLRPLGERVASRRGEVEIPDPLEARRRGFAALREMLGRIGDEMLLILSIDDLQWGDLDSGRLLRELTSAPDPPPILLLGVYRSDERATSPIFKELTGGELVEPGIQDIELGELPIADAVELALAHLGDREDLSREMATELARESGGIPFFMNELVRHGTSGSSEEVGPMDTGRLDRAIEARLLTLPDDARRLLECFAVAGQPLDLAIANQAAGLDPGDTATVDQLRVERWVRGRGGTGPEVIETYHDRIRETVARLLPDDTLSSYHDRLAQALNRAGAADAETLAEHYAHAGDHELAARHALRAADQASEALAFDRAARLYELGFGLWEPTVPDARQTLRVRWADALANAGRGVEAARAYLEVAKTADSQERLDLRRLASEHFLNAGSIDEGLDVLQGVLSEVGMRLPGSPRVALAGLLMRRAQLRLRGLGFKPRRESEVEPAQLRRVDVCWTAGIGLAMVDVVRSAHFQARHLVLALKAGEPARVARALIAEAGASSASGSRGAKRTASLLDQCRVLEEEVDVPYVRGWLATVEAIAANLGGDFVTALGRARVGEKILREECTGVTWERDTALLYELHSLVNLGAWRALSDRSDAVLAEAQDRRDLYMSSYVLTRNRFIAHLLDDEIEEARAAQEVGLGSWSRQGFHVQHYWDWYARGEVDLYAGNPTAGWARIAAQWSPFRRSLLFLTQALSIEMRFLRARLGIACAIDDPDRPERYLEQSDADAKWLRGQKSRWADAAALLIDAGACGVRGDPGRARELAAGAASAFDELGIEHYADAARLRSESGPNGTSSTDVRWIDRESVKNPDRMLAMLAPGVWT